MYKLRYGRTYNMGNFQSDRIEIEHDFTNETSLNDAIKQMICEVEKSHEASMVILKRRKELEEAYSNES